MEPKEERLEPSNEGAGNVTAGEANGSADAQPPVAQEPTETENYDHLPPELRPVDGKFPKLTEALMRKLRGKYFTVKHPRLQACGHKMDLMNEPRTNCEDCWFAWFNTHQKLVEVADEMYRTKGKEALIGMRGRRFFKMFVRFMITVIALAKEQEQRELASRNQDGNAEAGESGSGIPEATDERGQAEGDSVDGEVTQ